MLLLAALERSSVLKEAQGRLAQSTSLLGSLLLLGIFNWLAVGAEGREDCVSVYR